MQQYAITGDWEHSGTSSRWLEWSSGETDEITGWFELKGRRIRMYTSDAIGAPDERFAAGHVNQKQLLQTLDSGPWGSNPGADATVDIWGNGINKLAHLLVTNKAIYNATFDL